MLVPTGSERTVTIEPRLWMGEDGIMRVDYGLHAHITLEAVREVAQRAYQLCPRPHLALVMGQRVAKVDTDALRFLQGEEYQRISVAVAVMTRTPLEKFLMRMYSTLHPPTYPVRGFTDEEEALRWLRGHGSLQEE
ncbi:hypothetical protein [Aestuariirhabdus litorea]|uniref:DUF7793 domain-containing protein n=1 Tax=Aestuariirhabdus litorea TaxID=2528527 RepID=A0A3P3VU09_9GAMM|nr:hypothetical protein [Aestuariirhabdus litorea]RRJ84939.1 hypothetical protein D0544_07610 [Aestuariirhabdus litorea]RWW98164.1 hypothetical protein DZC74_07605 [Endozoicomonadaceae bacterium GTF-13]